MELVNQHVIYRNKIGITKEAKIIKQIEDKIYLDILEKPLIFPDAFDEFLKFKEGTLQAEVELLIAEKKANAEAKKREEHEAEMHAIKEAKRVAEEKIAAEKHKKSATTDRHADENNLAFKCNFCNGNCSDNCLGYKGVCSDEQIKQNIKDGRAWCSNPDSPCYKYVNGMLTRKNLDDLNSNGTFVCYEARMLIDWKAEAGEDVDDNGVHKARRITNASSNSLAVLTTTLPKTSGKDRVIFGVFITGVVDEGDDVKAGYVKAKDDYHIELTPGEAKQMKFWNYHQNPRNAESTQWGSGLYRYMKDSTCVRILEDIVKIKTDPREKAHAQKVMNYYCKIKGFDINNITVTE